MRKSKKKLLAMLLAGTMVFGMLPSNAFANNEQDPTSTVVDEPVTTDDSTKLEEEGDTNQGTTEVEAPVEEANPQEAETENKTEEALPEGDANTEVAVDLSLEEVKLQKTEEIKAGEKYIIVYDNKKALSIGKDNIIAVPVEIEGNTVKTEITKNIIWTVDDKGNLTTEEDKYLTSDLELQEKVEEGQSFKLDKKNVSYEENEVNTYLTYNEEKNEWSFEEKENEAVTYYNVVGPVDTLEELTEEELDKIEEENKPEEPAETPAETPTEGENPNGTPDEPQDPTETPVEGTEGTTSEGDDEVGIPEDGVEDEVVADVEQEEAVVDDSVGDKYKLHTGDIVAGEYIIVAGSDNYALTNNNNSVGKTPVIINSNNEITANNNNNYIWTFSGSKNRYSITNGGKSLLLDGSWFGSWSYSLKLDSSNTNHTINNIDGKYEISRRVGNISQQRSYLTYDNEFKAIGDSSTVRLYKKVEKVTLTANFLDKDGNAIVTTQEFKDIISGSGVSVNTPTIPSNYEFDYMTVNGGSQEKQARFTFENITENTVVNYYYKTKSGGGSTGTAEDIILNKTATNERLTTDGRGYMYDITLSVLGKEVTSDNPVDVTIVLDDSGSMKGSNLTNLKLAVTEFINNTLKDDSGNIRISFARYSSDASVYNFSGETNGNWNTRYSSITVNNTNDYFTSDKDKALEVLNKLSADGATNTEEGLKAANKLTSIRNRDNAQSIVLFMTDGVPTYSSSSNSGGSSTSVNEFNGAVSAGVSLKNAGNTVYTIGLLVGLNDSKTLICNNLLSDEFMYNATIATGYNPNNNSLEDIDKDTLKGRFTTSTPAYSSGYYKVTNASTAASEMKKIYQDLAAKVLSLATGTVTDIIPAQFKLTEVSKNELISAGHSVNENDDGTTTIVFKDTVTATSTKYQLPTFTIEPNTDAYGAKYTNVSATYNYTLYDKTTGSKDFNIPQGFITPLTTPDVYHTTVNTMTTIDTLLSNDPSYNKKLQQGYTLSDLIYRLVDKDGNSIEYVTGANGEKLTIGTDGKFKFTSPVEGTFTFYYVAEGTAQKTDSLDELAPNDKVLTSKPTLVTVHVYGLSNKTYVIDYGKPVTYKGSEVFNGNFEDGANITLTNGNGNCGTLTMDSANKNITYTLNRYMDQIEKFNFNVENTYDSTNLTLTKIVTIMPATSVYYEDNFGVTVDSNGKVTSSTGIQFSGSWIQVKEGNSGAANQDSGLVEGNVQSSGLPYGQDSSYLNNDKFSNGSAMMISSENNDGTNTATFTFKGTGFDLISRTKNDTGSIIVEISKVNEDKTLTRVKKNIVNNQYQSGDLYQIPVINFDAFEHHKQEVQKANESIESESEKHVCNEDCKNNSFGTYQVDITVGKTTFYLDAIRIYNPLGFNEEAFEEAYDRYADDSEANANIREVRNLLIASGDFNADNSISNGAVFIDAEGETPGQKTSSISDYKNLGPNNEVYLSNGQSVAFKIEGYENAASIQIGLKTPNSNTVDNNVVINKNVDATKQQLVTVKTATDMYYDITDIVKGDKGLITINNLSTDILAITNIKITSGTKTTTFNIVSDQETVVIANMLAYEASNNKSADIDGSGVVDIYDLANVASNQNKEVIIGVSTDIYRQDLTGTRTINREDLNIVKDNIQ